MSFLLTAINAKYIHSNLAVYSLQAYARAAGHQVEVAEYTINHQKEYILRSLYRKKPAVIGFSCYIWNMIYVEELSQELHKLLPDTPIWLGGPEVSWNPEERLLKMPWITGIMVGEGEETLSELAGAYEAAATISSGSPGTWQNAVAPDEKASLPPLSQLKQISGLCLRDGESTVFTPWREMLSMDCIPFPYGDLGAYENRIIYYESSRGCPFSCSYCLSSVEKRLRFRSLSLVLEELDFFLRAGVAQVKFVDRTFNCRHSHAYAIWQFITEHDNGKTNFHFEISADLLQEEDFALFARMRPGLIQLETGVQTTNPDTIRAIGRTMNLEKVEANTKRIKAYGNIHQHLDLIAGLPEEDLESFARSFDQVYAMEPDELQLGFLKVLHGTEMERRSVEYGLVYQDRPAYEVLATRWLSYEDVLCLKNVEDAVETYYNSSQYAYTLAYVLPFFSGPFDFFRRLGDYREAKGYLGFSQSRMEQYEILRAFLMEAGIAGLEPAVLDEQLIVDYCLREKLKKLPGFLPDQEPYKHLISDYFTALVSGISLKEVQKEAGALKTRKLDRGAQPGAYRKLRGESQIVVLPNKKELIVFDYSRRDPLNHNAAMTRVKVEITGGYHAS